jgi:hypothetical protein
MKYSPMRSASGKSLLTTREGCYALWWISATISAVGLQKWLHPPSPPFTGQFAWLYTYAEALLGSKGPAMTTFAFAFVVAALGLFVWRRASRLSTLDIRPSEHDDTK